MANPQKVTISDGKGNQLAEMRDGKIIGSPEKLHNHIKEQVSKVVPLKGADATRPLEDDLKAQGVSAEIINEHWQDLGHIDGQNSLASIFTMEGVDGLKQLYSHAMLFAHAYKLDPDQKDHLRHEGLASGVKALESLVQAQQTIKTLATKVFDRLEKLGWEKVDVTCLVKERKVSKSQLELDLEDHRAKMNKLHGILEAKGVTRIGDPDHAAKLTAKKGDA